MDAFGSELHARVRIAERADAVRAAERRALLVAGLPPVEQRPGPLHRARWAVGGWIMRIGALVAGPTAAAGSGPVVPRTVIRAG
jgi:hypothetical protein